MRSNYVEINDELQLFQLVVTEYKNMIDTQTEK